MLQKRQNTGYMDGYYSVVAGHLEGDETVLQAMIREAKEEAAITLHPNDLDLVGVMHRRSGQERIDFFITSSEYQGEIKIMEPHKCSDMRWFEINKLPENLIPYVEKAINNYFDGQWFDNTGFA